MKELLAYTQRTNLGVLTLEEAVSRLESAGKEAVLIAEMKAKYGDMGRCGVLHPNRHGLEKAIVESLAISYRARTRRPSLSMLVGLRRHSSVEFRRMGGRYVSNGLNRPPRMLLMATGFQRQPGTDELILSADRLAKTEFLLD